MSAYEWKTKKEKILENARRDPFLKIEDLARIASTTPCYVRTILSEANISLMKLRKDYARRMENRDTNICEKILLNYLIKTPFNNEDQSVKQKGFVFNNPADFELLSGDIQNDYFFQTYLHKFKESPWCLSTVILKENQIEIPEDNLLTSQIFSILCDDLKKMDMSLSNIDIEIELATNQVAELLNMSPLTPIFRVRQSLKTDTGTIALMLLYFNYKKTTLSLSHTEGMVINRRRVSS